MKTHEIEQEIALLKDYFSKRPNVLLSFIFGSHASQRIHKSSDWDIAVYFKPVYKYIEWEDLSREYPEEDEIWEDCIDLLKTDNIDLLVLNRAPASVAASALNGIPLTVKDHGLWCKFMLIVTREAEDYRQFVDEYYAILQRSFSLNPYDKEIIKKTLSFIEEQISLYSYFKDLSEKDYSNDIHKRNDVERWIENVVNASIDIAKVILAGKRKAIPGTYREIMKQASWELKLDNDEEFIVKFGQWTRLRNILAHEYLDIKWQRISAFIQNSSHYIKRFIEAAKNYIAEV